MLKQLWTRYNYFFVRFATGSTLKTYNFFAIKKTMMWYTKARCSSRTTVLVTVYLMGQK